MTTLFYSPGALADMERPAESVLATDPQAAGETGRILMEVISKLARHPLVGRTVEGGLRELVMSWWQLGHVALYRFDANTDQVFILAVRHQREDDYR